MYIYLSTFQAIFVFISICKYLINAIFQEVSLENNDNLLSLWSFLYTDGSIAKGLTKNKFLGLKGIRETRKGICKNMGNVVREKKAY